MWGYELERRLAQHIDLLRSEYFEKTRIDVYEVIILDHIDPNHRLFDQASIFGFGFVKRLLGFSALGNVLISAEHTDYFSFGAVQRYFIGIDPRYMAIRSTLAFNDVENGFIFIDHLTIPLAV